jgi:hypothetical protein
MNKTLKGITLVLVGLLAAAPMALAQSEGQGEGSAVVTMLPKKASQPTANVTAESLKLKVNGKSTSVSNWKPLRGEDNGVQLVLLIDNGVRTSLAREMGEMQSFVRSLPPNVKMTIGYMQNGSAVLEGPFTTDHAKLVKELRLPLGVPGESASPYFCLSDLAKHWPSNETHVRRVALMITNGVDPYDFRYDPQDPYVQAAIRDSIRARVLVYSIYWTGSGFLGGSGYVSNTGQNLLALVTEATGGKSYWMGFGNPVTLDPYFQDLLRRFNNQYELTFTARLKGSSEIQQFRVKTSDSSVKTDAPQQVLVTAKGTNHEE